MKAPHCCSALALGAALTVVPVLPAYAQASGLTRADVLAELVRARAAGELDWAYLEVYGRLPPAGSVEVRPLRVAERP